MELFVLFFIIGLFIGSFLNVVILRLHLGEGIFFGRSRCLQCRHTLGIFDLIPLVSYVIRSGVCHYCKQQISKQYPLVELFTGLVFGTAAFFFGLSIALPFILAALSGLVVILFYDFLFKLIPDVISIPTFFCALIGSLLSGISLGSVVIGVLVGGGFFLLQFVLSRGKWIGGGDIRLGMIGGALLGWPLVLLFLFISYVFGSAVSIILMGAKKNIKLNSYIPFGPYLVVGMLISLFWGEHIVSWYISLL